MFERFRERREQRRSGKNSPTTGEGLFDSFKQESEAVLGIPINDYLARLGAKTSRSTSLVAQRNTARERAMFLHIKTTTAAHTLGDVFDRLTERSIPSETVRKWIVEGTITSIEEDLVERNMVFSLLLGYGDLAEELDEAIAKSEPRY